VLLPCFDGCDLFRAQKQAVFGLCFEGCVC
jgi:hypothetical protein